MLLRATGLCKRIGDRALFEDVALQMQAGDRIGLVGPNGAGKSTLLRVLCGDESSDAGAVSRPRDVTVEMLRQEIDPRQRHSSREEAGRALAHLDALEQEMRSLEHQMAEAGRSGGDVPAALAERYHLVSTRFDDAGGFERDARIASVLAGLGFDDEARERPLSSFSGGWLMRVELAKLMLAQPDVLLLDEPTNHLDLPAIEWFESALASFRGAVLTVSHDRTFLRRHVARVIELDGRGGVATYEGNYDHYLADRAQRMETLLAAKAKQDREIAQMERFVERFRAKASKARQAQSRIKALEKIERIEAPSGARRRMRLRISVPARSGDVAMTLAGVRKRYDTEFGEKTVYESLDFQIRRGERVALAGPNGAGKSTLLRLVAGVLGFEEGTRTPGHKVQIGFYAQHQLESLDASRSVLEELSRGANTGDVPRLRGHLGAFLFSGDDVDKKVGVLSGGEKARLALARMLLHPRNLLVLDEPTNHLDIEACEVLEEALQQYQGTLLFVSHDRSFINALATRVVDVREGRLRDFLGGYDDYERKLTAEKRATEQAPVRDPVKPSTPPTSAAPAMPRRPPAREDRQRERERRKARERLTRKIGRLEEEIAGIESEIEAIGWKQGHPDLYRDVERMQALDAEKTERQSVAEERYREWERLSDELAALDDASGPSPGA